MDAQRSERLRQLFRQAADMQTQARQAFLDQACRDDDQLRRELRERFNEIAPTKFEIGAS